MSEKIGEIFTLDEVAAYLKVGKRTIYRLVSEKKIPAFKVGGAWRFTRADIDQWIREQARRPSKVLSGNEQNQNRSS